MNDDVRQEVIKALAFGEDREEIANFAEITMDELISMELDNAEEIREYRKEMEKRWQ